MVGASDGGDDLLVRNELRSMVEGKSHCVSDRLLPFVMSYFDLNKRHERTPPLTKVLIHYSKTLYDEIGG